MPKIPVYDGPQVESSLNIDIPKASTAVPTGGKQLQGRALYVVGQDMMKAATRIKARRDNLAVEDAYSKLYDEYRERTHGADGFFSRKGMLVETTKSLDEDLAKIRDSNSRGLANARQQEAFAAKTEALRQRILDAAAVHENTQSKAASILGLEADATRYAQEAQINPAKPLDYQLAVIALGEASIEQRERLEGNIDDTDLSNIKLQYSSGILSRNLRVLSESNSALAQERFQELGADEFTADHYEDLTKKLAEETLRGRAQIKTDEIWAEHMDDRKAGMAAANDIKGDPALRDAVAQRMGDNYLEQKKQEAGDYSALVDDTMNGLVEMVSEETPIAEARDYVARAGLHATELSQMMNYVDNKLGGKIKITNQAARVDAMRKIDSKEITDENQLKREYSEFLTPVDLQKVVDYLLAGGNLQGLKHSAAVAMFEEYTGRDLGEREKEFTKFWDYLKSKLVPGFKVTDDDLVQWGTKYLTRKGSIDRLILPDKNITYADAVRKSEDPEDDYRDYTVEERDAAISLMKKFNKENKDKQFNLNDPYHILWVVQRQVRGE